MEHMTSTALRTRYGAKHALSVGAALIVGLAVFAQDASRASPDDLWGNLPGFGGLTRERLTTEERRARARQARDALEAKIGRDFEPVPALVSEASLVGLTRAVQRYEAIVNEGGWPRVPERTLRPGDGGDGVRQLRRRLWLTGDLRRGANSGWDYDSHLESAVARFQTRHGLRISGFVDRRTRRALNVPAQARLHQLRTNLTRLRELAKINEDERYVLVNVPAYKLYAVEGQGQTVALESNVVVGKPGRETPDVSAKIRELNFYPYWRVPDSIAHKDLIPAIRKDPSYFYKEHFSVLKTWGAEPMDPTTIDWFSPKVFSYKFRQDPGLWNALGVVRINMPNKHIVYLHDTPLKDLFQQSARAFSSGCVRVEKVLDVANWLLRAHAEWTPTLVDAAVRDGVKRTYKLEKPVPVHFTYVTSWASESGVPYFRRDIYGRDGGAFMVAERQIDDAADDDRPKDDVLRKVLAISP